MTVAPPVLRTPTLTVVLAPAEPIGIAQRPEPVIAVAWPRVRVTQPQLPPRPQVIVLPAPGPQGWQHLGRVRIWSPPPRRG